MKICKKNREEYEPTSLISYQRSIDRYLREEKRQTRNILKDFEFKGSRAALTAKRKDLRKQGMGRKPNAAQALTKTKEDMLWEIRQLGGHSLASLLRTIWWLNTIHLGWRGRDEHRKACYGDFSITADKEGIEYVEWKMERGSKTRSGGENRQTERAFNPRMYATKIERCPVALFKKYMLLRPKEFCNDDSPLYLQEHSNPSETLWYKKQPTGRDKIRGFMKSMA